MTTTLKLIQSNTWTFDKSQKLGFRWVIIEADGTSDELEYVSHHDAALSLAQDKGLNEKLENLYMAEAESWNEEDFEEWVVENIEEITGCRIDPRIRGTK
jgi:hypothetical protein